MGDFYDTNLDPGTDAIDVPRDNLQVPRLPIGCFSRTREVLIFQCRWRSLVTEINNLVTRHTTTF